MCVVSTPWLDRSTKGTLVSGGRSLKDPYTDPHCAFGPGTIAHLTAQGLWKYLRRVPRAARQFAAVSGLP